MPAFRIQLAAADPRPITADLVREFCAAVTRPPNFFVAPPQKLLVEQLPNVARIWEIFHGQLLDHTQTRERRQFEAWNVHLVDSAGDRSAEPVVAVKFDRDAGCLFVTRAILCHAHETYDGGGNVILTREVRRWRPELVGTIHLDDLSDGGALHDELVCLLFQAVVGTSRLPLTSVETPLPGFALGNLGYCYRPGATGGPMTTVAAWNRVSAEVQLAPGERVKHAELAFRAGVEPEAIREGRRMLGLLRDLFNEVTLSPYTDFVPRTLAFVRDLVRGNKISDADRADFLAHLIRQLGRHLTAYDLVTFHHRGANYPDALFLDDLMSELLPLATDHPHLFAGAERPARLRRRAIRQGLLLRLQYAGHPVPDAPTSPGENLRVLPEPFTRVSDEQIYSPAARERRLFVANLPLDLDVVRKSIADLDEPEELQELGTALFADRPLGFAKAPGEPDQTWLASHVMFSRTVTESRLALLAARPEWLSDGSAINRWRERLVRTPVDGLPLRHAGPPPRPGVLSLQDALRVADDFVFLRTTRRALREFYEQYEIGALGEAVPKLEEWRLLIPGGSPDRPTLCLYDRNLARLAEFWPDVSRGYRTRGGAEVPREGLRLASVGA